MNLKKTILSLIILFSISLFIASCEDDEVDKSFAEENWSAADQVRGGLLYDKFWKVNGTTEPTTDFDPTWSTQSTNARTGSDTWRCKECHGWDYIGDSGRYSEGSHYTGFSGVYATSSHDIDAIFDAIKDEDGDHDFSTVLSDDDVLDLTKFIKDGLIDISLFVDANGAAIGDSTNGATLYNSNCSACHGADGNTIDFDDDDGDQGVGFLANDNPQEILHKIRWGHPGSSMPSMVGSGLSDEDSGDILTYAQTLQ